MVGFLGRCVFFGEMLNFLHSHFWLLFTEADTEKLFGTFPSLFENMTNSLMEISKETQAGDVSAGGAHGAVERVTLAALCAGAGAR